MKYQPKGFDAITIESVAEMIFIFRLENGLKGIVRADDMLDAASRVNDHYGNHGCVYLERMSEIENNDYGIYEID